MLKNRLLKVLPVLLALLLVFTVAVFATVAEGEDESADAVSEETSVEETSTDDSAASDEATDDSAASDESKNESSAASDESKNESSAASESKEDSDEKTPSNIPWKLIITVAVILVIAVVLFILAKTNSKLGQKIAKFFKDYKSEVGKISWMSRKDLLRSTLVVLAVLIIAAVAIGLLDFGFSSLVKLLSSIG